MNFNSEAAKQAFEDFKKYLNDIGMIEEGQNIQLAKMAFLHGFASGELHKNEAEPKQYAEFKTGAIVSDLQPEVAAKITAAKGKPRVMNVKRTEKKMEQDARLAASILQRVGKPMQLREITEAMNAAGADWYPNSASGHMLDVARRQPCVKKAGYGVWSYEQ